MAEAEGIRVAGMAPKMLWPVPTQQIGAFQEGKREVFVAEVNYSGQFAQLLPEHFVRPFRRLNVYAGEAFRVREILAAIRESAAATVR